MLRRDDGHSTGALDLRQVRRAPLVAQTGASWLALLPVLNGASLLGVKTQFDTAVLLPERASVSAGVVVLVLSLVLLSDRVDDAVGLFVAVGVELLFLLYSGVHILVVKLVHHRAELGAQLQSASSLV